MQLRLIALLGIALATALPVTVSAEPRHAIAMHGEPALPADFTHLPYADPAAPKGGTIDYAVQGSFDSLNPFIVQGAGARGLIDLEFGNNVFETLMQRSFDEPFTLYPLIAEAVETDDARSFVEFTIDADARFSDGEPVTADDVIFTVELLRDKGFPRYSTTMKKVARVEKTGERTVRFTFGEPDRELPLILGLMPVLPEHAIDRETFDKSTLKPIMGSGPYTIAEVRPGERVTLKKNPNYWAREKPSKVGFDNWDEIRLNYFRDSNALFEAFKKGVIDIQVEGSAPRWTTGYDFPAVAEGRVVKDVFRSGLPSGMYGFVMNTRRPVFAARKLRRALAMTFDFEWANKNLFSGVYARTRSFYDKSELSSHGRVADAAEMAVIGDAQIEPEILAGSWAPPVSDASGRDRTFLRAAYDAFIEAGCKLENGRMRDAAGRPLTFEVMLKGAGGEQLAMAWQRTLERLGIHITLRGVDDAQYVERQRAYDFDVIIQLYTSSLSPGVEQVGRWGSFSRDQPGTLNYAGVADPVVDRAIDRLLNARERSDFVTAVRAYDRILLNGFYVVPLYHQPEQWVARWSRVARPERAALYGYQLPTWWAKDEE